LNVLQDENGERLRARLRDAIQRDAVDVIVTLGTAETAIAKDVTSRLPIVFLPAGDPLESGFVRSLATPETNLTGLTFFTGGENIGKQLETFKHVIPAIRHVAVLVDGRQHSGISSRFTKGLRSIASWLGIDLIEKPVTASAEAAQAITALYRQGNSTGVFIVCTGLFRDLESLAAVAIKRRMPLFGCSAAQVAEQKVLMTYAPDLYAMGYRGAWFVDRILRGAKPQALPVETPWKFELVINRTTAQQIGVTIPREILALSDRVFD
jgi:putative ABC transport system substrate-binding protein